MAPRKTLEDSIRHLRSELADGEPLTEADRDLLERTLADVAQKLEESDDNESDGFSLTESVYEELQELSARIEQTRPSLSILLGRIIDSLSQLGI